MSRLPQRLAGATTVLAALASLLVGVFLASGAGAFVSTHGVSMNPLYHQGDLVVVARADEYSPGDIAAYHLHGGSEVVLHRIIDADADGFTLKGDNNQSVDLDHPAAADVIGKAVFHVKHGGDFLKVLTSPPLLGLVALALLSTAAPTLNRRRRRRAARSRPMSRHIPRPRATTTLRAMLEGPRSTWTATTAAVGLVALGLGAWAWAGPAHEAPAAADAPRMVFSYSAEVGRTPAYDTSSVTSPTPIFRRVTDTIDVHYSYRGPAATITPVAELSTPGGWNTTIPMGDPATTTARTGQGSITLDVAALEARASRASKVTGLPATPLTIKVVPAVAGEGLNFEPALELAVTPLQVSAVDPAAFTVTAAEPGGNQPVRAMSVGTWRLTAAAARPLSAALLVLCLAALSAIAVTARRAPQGGAAERFRRRWPSLLVPVHPMPTAAGRPIIDVVDFPTLAKLAERYGLLVLHWSRSDVETFIVQDDNTAYRYRTGDAALQEETLGNPLPATAETP